MKSHKMQWFPTKSYKNKETTEFEIFELQKNQHNNNNHSKT